MKKTAVVSILVMLALGSASDGAAASKEFPLKPIELVCIYTPGGTMDLWSRLVGEIAQKYLGQPVQVVSKPGATGSLGAAEVISSKPDGYKLVGLTNFFHATTVKTQKVPFDPDLLVPLATMLEFKHGLCVRGDSPWKTLSDLIEYARKNPGQLKWSHHGRGSTIHIIPLSMFKKAGVQTVDVPYKGGNEQFAALLGGHVDASSNVYSIPKDHVVAGKVRFLVFYSDRRFSDPADVPSAVELGYPEVEKLTTVVSIYTHKNTPENVKKILVDALKKTYDDPEYKKGVEKLGEVPRWGGPEAAMASIKKAEEAGVPIIKELGLYIGK
jgi:tripartite-type tricarboxylate transporter receptor subunit TctC